MLLAGAHASGLASQNPATEVPIQAPVVAAAFPLSVQAGRAALVTFEGNYFDQVRAVHCACADLNASIEASSPLAVTARIEALPSAEAGPRFLYLDSSKGPSNRVLFRVTRWQSVVETEPNDGFTQSQPVSTPLLIEGRIRTVHDSDMYRIRVEEGERLAFNVLTGRNKAPGHVVAVLMTTSGRVLARNLSHFGTDPYIDHTFAEAGEYLLTIMPRRFSDFYTVLSDDQEINWQYQVAIGRSPVLWSLFPMGGRRGTTVEVALRADFLDPSAEPRFSGSGLTASLSRIADPCNCRFSLSVDVSADAPIGVQLLSFPDPSGTSGPLAFAVGDTREVLELEPNDQLTEAQPITVPVIVNGRIDRPGDRDGLAFKVDQYDEIAFRADARGLGSRITDLNLTLARPDGELVNRGDDRCRDCGAFFSALKVKEKLDSSFRHYFQTGNPNDADAAGDYVVQVRDNSKDGGPNHTYRLLIRHKSTGFRLGALSDSVRGPIGGVAGIPVTMQSEEGFRGAIAVRVEGLPPGMAARPLTLWTDSPSGTVEIEHDGSMHGLDEEAGWIQARLRLTGTAEIDGATVTRAVELPSFYTESGTGYNEQPQSEVLVTFVEPPLLALAVDPPFRGFRLNLAKGGTVEVPLEITRREGFDDALRIDPVGFPRGLQLRSEGESNGGIAAVLFANAHTIPRGRHRIAIRASADRPDGRVTAVTSGFTVQVN